MGERQSRNDIIHQMLSRMDAGWITINGTHVMVDDSGNITKGPAALKSASGSKKTGKSGGKVTGGGGGSSKKGSNEKEERKASAAAGASPKHITDVEEKYGDTPFEKQLKDKIRERGNGATPNGLLESMGLDPTDVDMANEVTQKMYNYATANGTKKPDYKDLDYAYARAGDEAKGLKYYTGALDKDDARWNKNVSGIKKEVQAINKKEYGTKGLDLDNMKVESEGGGDYFAVVKCKPFKSKRGGGKTVSAIGVDLHVGDHSASYYEGDGDLFFFDNEVALLDGGKISPLELRAKRVPDYDY